MGIVVDGFPSSLQGGFAAPPISIGDEEELLFGELGQSGQLRVRRCLFTLLPGMKRRPNTASVCNILTKRKASIHMERFGVLARHSELGILVHKALCTLLKPFDRFLIPPVGIVSGFIIVSSSRVECYKASGQILHSIPFPMTLTV